jgi:hypothetical protein
MWVIGKTSRIEAPAVLRAPLKAFRDRFLETFVAAAAGPDFATVLPAVAAWRKRDPNVTADERAAIDRLLARVTLER